MDCGFLRLPTYSDFETVFRTGQRPLVILPENHALARLEKVPGGSLQRAIHALGERRKTEVSEIFERCNLTPNVHFTTWDDYAIMSMVESGLGINILPELILKRVPYRIVAKELDVPAYRKIGIALQE